MNEYISSIIPSDALIFPESARNDIRIDVKHSSFKKTLSLLKHFQTLRLLTLVANDRLGSINRQHELFREYKDQIKVDNVDEFKTNVFVASSTENNDKRTSTISSGNSHDNQNKLKIIDLFKFPRPIKEVFLTEIRNSIDEDTLQDNNIFNGEGMYNECVTNSEVIFSFSEYNLILTFIYLFIYSFLIFNFRFNG